MGAPYGTLKKAVAQPKPDKTGPIPRTLKIEITGGYGSGKESIAHKIEAMLKKDLLYSARVTTRLVLPPDGTETLQLDGTVSSRSEGPEDATFLIVVTQGEPFLDSESNAEVPTPEK